MHREFFGPNGPVHESDPPPDDNQGSKSGRDVPPATPPKPGQA